MTTALDLFGKFSESDSTDSLQHHPVYQRLMECHKISYKRAKAYLNGEEPEQVGVALGTLSDFLDVLDREHRAGRFNLSQKDEAGILRILSAARQHANTVPEVLENRRALIGILESRVKEMAQQSRGDEELPDFRKRALSRRPRSLP